LLCCSSGIIWEKKTRKQFRPVKNKYGVMLEDGYQLYLNDLAVGDKKAVASHRVVDKVEVWICTVIMLYYMI